MFDPRALGTYTEVRPSRTPGAGLGLFATRHIPRGTIWWRDFGDNVLALTRGQYETLRRYQSAQDPSCRQLLEAIDKFGYVDRDAGTLVVALDWGRFVNHSPTPNSGGSDADPERESMALCDIEPGDEITEDYRTYDSDAWGLAPEPFLADPK